MGWGKFSYGFIQTARSTFFNAIRSNGKITSKNVEDALIEIAKKFKSGIVSAGSFSGNPKKYTVVFTESYVDTGYIIGIDGIDARSWTYEDKSVSGFTINANANQVLTGEVSWGTMKVWS